MKATYRVLLLVALALKVIYTSLAANPQGMHQEYSPENHIYQWSISLPPFPGIQGDYRREAYLWIPPSCQQLQGLVLCCHNAIEEGIIEDAIFRNGMEQISMGILWITPNLDPEGLFDVDYGARQILESIINTLSALSGYDELRTIPLVPLSHSSQASQPWNLGAWLPERTLAIISYHGDSPRSTYLCCNHYNPDWGDRNIDGIPSLLCVGETEFNEFRIEEALKFERQYPHSLISFLCNAGRGHGDFCQEDLKYLVYFITQTARRRLDRSNGDSIAPKRIERAEGWLADRWHKYTHAEATTNNYNSYHGNRDSAFWYLDETMARWTESIYTRERNKKKQYITVMQDGHLLKPGEPLHYDDNGADMFIRFRLVYTDSSYTTISDHHSIEPIHIKRFCGGAYLVNDSTIHISSFRSARKRNDNIGLFIFSESDMKYSHAVQYLNCPIPERHTQGKPQKITFLQPKPLSRECRTVRLNAQSTSGLPVQFYVISGPAYISDGNILHISQIPSKAKYPVEIKVRAWQPGRGIAPEIQSAEPVEQSIFIH